ncbi:MAG: energy transducer TonB, partial [Candidatus Marinimicrobia bacterium]|nr:energy transducer TonB [Candidatus Neomarinimicrobiota bacterium]
EAIAAEKVRTANIKGSIEWLDKPPSLLSQRHPAQPRGGYPAIKSNIRYPIVARSQGIEGNVMLACYIDETGSFTKVSVLKSMPGGLNEAAVAAIQKTPFDPAIDNAGKPLASWVAVSVFFNLDEIE